MNSDGKIDLSHAGSPGKGNPALSSDRVEAPVAGAGSTDCGRSQTSLDHDNTGNDSGLRTKDRNMDLFKKAGVPKGFEGRQNTAPQKTKTPRLDELRSNRKLMLDVDKAKCRSAPTSLALNVSEMDLIWDDDRGQSVKRRRGELEGSPGESREFFGNLASTIRRVIKNLEKEVGALAGITSREKNTKKEIKEAAITLKSLISQITTNDAKALLQTLDKPRKESIPILIDPDLEDRGVQTDFVDTPREDRMEEKWPQNKGSLEEGDVLEGLREENTKLKEDIKKLENKIKDYEIANPQGIEARKVREALENNLGIEEFLTIKNLNWPNTAYKNTTLKAGNPLAEANDTDLAIIKEFDGAGIPPTIYKMYAERYPELKSIGTGRNGNCSAMVSSCRVIGSNLMAPTSKERYIYLGEAIDLETLFETMCNMRTIMQKYERKKAAIPRPEKIPLEIARKLIEYVFYGIDIEFKIYSPTANDPKPTASQENTRRNNAIIVDSQGADYSELLKKVKEGITKSNEITELKAIRRTKQGNVLVELTKEDAKRPQVIAEEIQKLIEGSKVRAAIGTAGQKKKIQLRDLDLLATEKDVIDSIKM